jgi:hypothetical protein
MDKITEVELKLDGRIYLHGNSPIRCTCGCDSSQLLVLINNFYPGDYIVTCKERWNYLNERNSGWKVYGQDH